MPFPGIEKGRSCFLSGVSGLFHLKGKSKQSDSYAEGVLSDSELLGRGDGFEGELQEAEWTILKQLTEGKLDSVTSAPSHKAGLLALLVARGLISQEDLTGYHSAVTAYGGAPTTSGAPTIDLEGKKTERVLSDGMPLGVIPAIVDGPYLCTSLNHRSPVIDVTWRDDGPVNDVVFVPSVLCSLTMDNCITVWLESAADVSS